VGYNYDNIWRAWSSTKPSSEEMQVGGIVAKQGQASPKGKDDACLVNDRNDLKE
jgi:hypothetical protein